MILNEVAKNAEKIISIDTAKNFFSGIGGKPEDGQKEEYQGTAFKIC